MRVLLILAVLGAFTLGTVHAQNAHSPYVGVGAAILPAFGSVLPLVTIQTGTPLVDFLEARVKLDTVFSFNVIEADLLITPPLDPSFKPYLGAGIAFAFPSSSLTYDGVVTVGLEYAPSSVGFFGEIQGFASSLLNGLIEPFFRLGVNFHF